MTITVYRYNPDGDSERQFEVAEGEEFTSVLQDGKTHVTIRGNKEGEGFSIIHPPNIQEIIGKRNFRSGDVLALAEGYELIADSFSDESEEDEG